MSSLLNWTNNIRRRFRSDQNDQIGMQPNDIDIGRRILDPGKMDHMHMFDFLLY